MYLMCVHVTIIFSSLVVCVCGGGGGVGGVVAFV